MFDGDSIKALIAIPAYNEETRISSLLRKLGPWKNQVLVVDDASTDHTYHEITKEGFRCYRNMVNTGLSGFYKVAWDFAAAHGYTHILSLDGDGQHDPAYIPLFITALRENTIVVGNRFHHRTGIPPSKIASNLFAILLFRQYLNISLPDVACGFRAFKIDSRYNLPVTSKFGIIYEMLIFQSQRGSSIGTVPIPAIYFPDAPLDTKIDEINGLLETILRYHAVPELQRIVEAIQERSDFQTTLCDIGFLANHCPPDSYRFKVDVNQAEKMFQSLQDTLTQKTHDEPK